MMFRFEERYCICVDDGKDNIGQQTTYYSNHDEANKTTHLLIMWSRMTFELMAMRVNKRVAMASACQVEGFAT